MSRDETMGVDLQYDGHGLIPAIVSDVSDNRVLMFAYMNRAAFELTQKTQQLHLYSRSRQKIWKKGETSGEVFHVIRLLTDCDQDVIQVVVQPMGIGAACHTGRKSCFYRQIEEGNLVLTADSEKLFDPAEVYNLKS